MKPVKKWNLPTKASVPSGRKKREYNFTRSSLFPPGSKVTLIIDGSNMFVRNCSIPNLNLLTNPAGQKTGGLFGTLKSIVSEVRLWLPTSVYFVLDKSGSTRKKKLFPEYKSGRGHGLLTQLAFSPEEQEEIQQARQEAEARQRQLDVLERLLPNLGIRFVSVAGVEADDLIGSIASLHENSVISSSDTDFIQLHDGVNTIVYNPITRKIRSVEDFGVTGPSYAVLKSVIGDKTDFISGIRGIGWKTLTKWCGDSFPSNLDELEILAKVKDDRVGKKIQENKELIARNFELISLSPDVTDVYPHILLSIKAWTEHPPKFCLNEALAILKPENIGMSFFTNIMSVMTNLR